MEIREHTAKGWRTPPGMGPLSRASVLALGATWTVRTQAKTWCLCVLAWLCLVALGPATGGSVAFAQASTAEDPAIQQLRVQVLPEYDDPRVLVVVQGRLSAPGTAFPLPVTFRLPVDAQINQMASMDMLTRGTVSLPYDVQPDPEDPRWSLVTYTLDNAHFFYEYYYQPIEGQMEKQFAFTFSSPQAVGELLLEVQQPLAAEDFRLAPTPTTTRTDESQSFVYHQLQVGELAAGKEVAVQVSYTKIDPAPSLSLQQMMAVMDLEGIALDKPHLVEASPSGGTVPFWFFALLGSVVLASLGGLIWYRAQQDSRALAPALEASRGSFCRQCGTALKSGAQFCHYCGKAAMVGNELVSLEMH